MWLKGLVNSEIMSRGFDLHYILDVLNIHFMHFEMYDNIAKKFFYVSILF